MHPHARRELREFERARSQMSLSDCIGKSVGPGVQLAAGGFDISPVWACASFAMRKRVCVCVSWSSSQPSHPETRCS
jgi:hypothetical protein